jgi:preprotein translocase subunit YajC
MQRHHRNLFAILMLLALTALPAIAQDDGVQSPEEGQPTGQPTVGAAPESPQTPTPETTGEQDTASDQPEDANKEQEQPPPDEGPLGGPWFFVIMIGGFILLYWIMGSSRRKQEAKRREMLNQLSKGDKVITIGGIVGTAVEVRDDEITVKVDDGTRMKFARWAIRQAGDDVKEEKKEGADKK